MFLALSLSDAVFIMLISVKMSTIVGILTFMGRIDFVLSCVEHGYIVSFITSGPETLPVEPSGAPGHKTTKNINPTGPELVTAKEQPQKRRKTV